MSPPAVDAGSPIAIREFQFEGQGVRTASKPTGTEFVAVDVCGVLGHSNSRMALKRLHPSEKGVSVVYTPGGMQEVATVTESGLYALILSSRKPQALRFRLWVTSVVLPAIARSGGYQLSGQQLAKLGALAEPRFFAAPGWQAATVPLRMCEFLRVVGMSDADIAIEAPIRESELRLIALEIGRDGSGFIRPGTECWVFYRAVLDAWWAGAAREVVGSIRARGIRV